MPRIAFSLVPILLFSANLLAQVAPASRPIVRDDNAIQTVQAAITALGGATAIAQAQSWQAQGQVQAVGPDEKPVTGTVTWEMAGSEIRLASQTSMGPGAFLTGHGSPTMVSNAGNRELPPHVIAALFVPAFVGPILLKDLQNSDCEFRYAPPKTSGSESVNVVNIMTRGIPNPIVTAQTWYFDSTTNLPVRVEFRIPSMQRPELGSRGAYNLSNYQLTGGVLYPLQIVGYRQGKQTGAVTLQSVNVNAAIPSSDFDPPTAGAQ